jgi:hypothetical protein
LPAYDSDPGLRFAPSGLLATRLSREKRYRLFGTNWYGNHGTKVALWFRPTGFLAMTKRNETPQKRTARLSDEAAAWHEYQAREQATLQNMERLRALRLGVTIQCESKPKRKRAAGVIKQLVAEIVGDGKLAEEGKRDIHGRKPIRRRNQTAAAQ